MKKLLLSTAVLALTAGAALAADLPSRKAEPLLPPPPPPPMWTGFYAGLNAGYGFGTNSNTQSLGVDYTAYNVTTVGAGAGVAPAIAPFGVGYALSGYAPMTQSGFIGGGQIGYNYQWGSNFVIGIEADIQGTGIRGSSTGGGIGGSGNVGYVNLGAVNERFYNSSSIGATRVNAGVDWMGTVRGRLGYLWTPTMLVYATGGLTYGGVYANISQGAIQSTTLNDVPPGPGLLATVNNTWVGGGSKSQTLVGWNVGGGLEWMFMPNWSLKAEGIYWNMGNMNVATAAFSPAALPGANLGGGPGNPFLNANFVTSGASAFGGSRVNYQGVIARLGVNYHFNWGAAAPIVAKY